MRNAHDEPGGDALPAYGECQGHHVLEVGSQRQSTHFGSLTLPEVASSLPLPDVDTLLAHLRLLSAFEKLKEYIGYLDGLWDIWDSRAASAPNPPALLAKLREKRWALFVARAVDRYEAWWRSSVPEMLLEKDMIKGQSSSPGRYERFAETGPALWTADSLPPLDVLLVWHTHMLNPRLYLEDCLRYGYGPLWASGIPWRQVSAAIDMEMVYSVSDACIEAWSARTGRQWDNRHDPMEKELRCPACMKSVNVPWTTCGLVSDHKEERDPSLSGHGFGDGDLQKTCETCHFVVTHKALRFAKFRKDAQSLVTHDYAMPGTILDQATGLPSLLSKETDERLLPSNIIKRSLLVALTERFKDGVHDDLSMAAVRDMIEKLVQADSNKLNKVQEKSRVQGLKELATGFSLTGRRQIRKMMGHYWENSTFAGLELCSAIMRQGVFVSKMHKIDWLHSTTSRETMEHSRIKYLRFMEIIAAHPNEAAVPTLDVDLAWHTHQLSPRNYLAFTVSKTKTFVDHNDKVDEDKLSISFEWMSKTYMDKYGEPYAECTCWYCESTRVMNATGVFSNKLFASKDEKKLEAWHASGASSKLPQPPIDESAHISSHPSVHSRENPGHHENTRLPRQQHKHRLKDAYAKAQKNATKALAAHGSRTNNRSRLGPRGEDTFEHWGQDVPVSSPAASPLAAAATPSMYATEPGTVHCGFYAVGACARGTCGGPAGCANGTLALCAANCVSDHRPLPLTMGFGLSTIDSNFYDISSGHSRPLGDWGAVTRQSF